MELGSPISYEALERGTPVLSSEQERIGTVVHVLADEAEDVFDGIVVVEHRGDGHRFADADDVAEIHERGVVLRRTTEECERLPRPTANPAVIRADPANPPDHGLTAKLRRAWDLVSGEH
ncbi:MAG: hypothetical protein JOZ07_15055 [Solirubrobacterales bacterium]|nr:hypothetical protein [Solirubrobacterales bacterium]